MERESIEVDFEPEETEQGGAGESDAGAGGEDEPRADVMLGVVWQRRANSARLGAAWIVDDEIHCAELEEHAPHFEQLKQLKLTVDPSVMIAPSSSDVQLLEQLALDPVSGAEEHFMVQLLKPADCTVEAARRALGFLRTADCPSDLPNEHLASFHYTKLPEDGPMLCAVGVLLAACARSGGAPNVLRIVLHAVGKNMVLDSCALHSLSIFKQHLHPSAYGGKAKEGLSLFALLNRTRSKVGERQLRQWFSAPTYDRQVLDARLDAVSFFVGAASNGDLFTHVREALAGAKDMARCISRIRTGCKIADLKELRDHCGAHRQVHELLTAQSIAAEERGLRLPTLLRRFVDENALTASLTNVAQLLSALVNFPASTAEATRVVINDGVDAERDRLVAVLDSLQEALDEASALERDAALGALIEGGLLPQGTTASAAARSPLVSLVCEMQVLYVPQLGFFLNAPSELLRYYERNLPEELRPRMVIGHEGFASGERVYCKSATADHLDASVGDIVSQIADRDLAIVHQLETRLLQKADKLLASLELLANLDAVSALAHAAHDLGFCRPDLTDERVVELQGAWHPIAAARLAEAQEFIPNDIALGTAGAEPTREAMMVLTGPNGSGKSVYLKQVALAVFLAHVGSFVPAKSARIGLTDRIQTRIFSRETASIAKSTFMYDMHQVALMLSASTERSLLVLDEFGKGTHFTDGLSLLASFVIELAERGSACPRLLVATHFTELLDLPQIAAVRLQHKTMQALVEPASGVAVAGSSIADGASAGHGGGESVLLLYKVIDGRSSHSFACSVGRAVGVPDGIITRAEELQALVRARKPVTARSAHAEDVAIRTARVIALLRGLNINSKEAVDAFLASIAHI